MKIKATQQRGKVISIINHKGGVGKTTTTINLGALLAEKGKRVLLVDMDAQANLTGSLYKGEIGEKSIYYSLKDTKAPSILPIQENLDIVPSSVELALIEQTLNKKGGEFLLAFLLEPLRLKYDYILIDCPPTLSRININCLVASKETIIVLTPEGLPTKGLNAMETIIAQIQQQANKGLKLSGVVITRWEGTKLHKHILTYLQDKYKCLLYETKIRKNTDLAEAPLYQQAINTYSPRSNGAKDYRALTEEFLKREGE